MSTRKRHREPGEGMVSEEQTVGPPVPGEGMVSEEQTVGPPEEPISGNKKQVKINPNDLVREDSGRFPKNERRENTNSVLNERAAMRQAGMERQKANVLLKELDQRGETIEDYLEQFEKKFSEKKFSEVLTLIHSLEHSLEEYTNIVRENEQRMPHNNDTSEMREQRIAALKILKEYKIPRIQENLKTLNDLIDVNRYNIALAASNINDKELAKRPRNSGGHSRTKHKYNKRRNKTKTKRRRIKK
jgi:hypothetical protein